MTHAWVEVDLEAIQSNIRAIRCALKPWVDVIAMVKGNAYGHGAVDVSAAALRAGARHLGVAFAGEGMQLRERGLNCPIILMGSFSRAEVDDIVDYELTPSIWELEMAREVSTAARRRGRRVPVHVDVDTGMGRLGVRYEKAAWFIDNLRSLEGLKLEGIFTHLSSADEDDQTYSQLQVRRFVGVLERLRERGIIIPFTHVQNSAGVLNLSDLTFQGVRPGLALYGLYPSPRSRRRVDLKPALSFYARVVLVKRVPPDTFVGYNRTYRTSSDRLLATISAGYADGLPRELSSRGRVLINGRAYPIVGKVSMDHTVVDLDQDDQVRIGDRVTIIGRDGAEEITADEVADLSGTISYDITTGISHRVARTYHGVETALREAVAERPRIVSMARR